MADVSVSVLWNYASKGCYSNSMFSWNQLLVAELLGLFDGLVLVTWSLIQSWSKTVIKLSNTPQCILYVHYVWKKWILHKMNIGLDSEVSADTTRIQIGCSMTSCNCLMPLRQVHTVVMLSLFLHCLRAKTAEAEETENGEKGRL